MNIDKSISEEEAILKQEPLDNAYLIIEPSKMDIFPYFLLGVLKCTFINEEKTEISEGVGMIIGSDIVLTSAHNLYYRTQNDTFLYPNDIHFTPMSNGIYKLYEDIPCKYFTIPEKFRELKKKESFIAYDPFSSEEIIKYDYGIVFMCRNIGEDIIKILNHNSVNYHIADDTKLFSFFEEHINKLENLECLKKKNNFSGKISMVSYTRYNSDYLKFPNFRYKSSFNNINNKGNKNILRTSDTNNTSISGCSFSTQGNTLNKTTSLISDVGATLESLKYNKENINFSSIRKNQMRDKYFIMNNEQDLSEGVYNRAFYDENQAVLCEARGRLCHFPKQQNEPDELNYMITTYGGQSGSPVFLRIKKKNTDCNIDKNEKYEYILIGIHSRCPKDFKNQSFLNQVSITKDAEYENSNIQSNSKDIYKNKSLTSTETEYILKKLKVNNIGVKDSVLFKTGYSTFNIGLKLSSDILDSIKSMIMQKRSETEFILYLDNATKSLHQLSNYTCIDFISYDDVISYGFFHREAHLFNVFNYGENIFLIPSKYICFKLNNKLYTYDKNNHIKLSDIIYDSNRETENEESINNYIPRLAIFIFVDLEQYANTLAEKITRKITETEGKVKAKVDMVKLVKYIFDEIQPLYKISIYIHGLLFQSIKERMLDI